MTTLLQDLAPLSQALSLRAHRQQVLASNIANADTPNYKARDFDFQSALSQALAGRLEGDLRLSATANRHMSPSGVTASPRLQYRSGVQASADGNTVDMDIERAQISDNALQYEMLSNFVTDRIKSFRMALTDSR